MVFDIDLFEEWFWKCLDIYVWFNFIVLREFNNFNIVLYFFVGNFFFCLKFLEEVNISLMKVRMMIVLLYNLFVFIMYFVLVVVFGLIVNLCVIGIIFCVCRLWIIINVFVLFLVMVDFFMVSVFVLLNIWC